MRRWLRALSLRVRLIAGYVVAMTIVLSAAAAFVYWRVEYALDRGLDAELRQATAAIRPLVLPTGTLSSLEQAAATGAGWQVVDADGSVLAHGGPVRSQPALSRTALQRAGDRAVTVDVGSLLPISDHPLRVRATPLPSGRHLLVTVRRDHRDEALRELLAQLGVATLGALLVASVVGDLLARAALRPVERYRRQAGASSALTKRSAARRSRSAARARPGSGLGLSLVAELVTEYGGELRLCHGGEHVSYGHVTPFTCPPGDEMRATVVLPLVPHPVRPPAARGEEDPN